LSKTVEEEMLDFLLFVSEDRRRNERGKRRREQEVLEMGWPPAME